MTYVLTLSTLPHNPFKPAFAGQMESHEERLHKMIIQSKINETKDVMKRKAMEIDKSKVERAREGLSSNYVPAPAPSVPTSRTLDLNTPSFSRWGHAPDTWSACLSEHANACAQQTCAVSNAQHATKHLHWIHDHHGPCSTTVSI